ncbi:ATP-dependent RNA helicase DbpA [Granulosicoccus antarcticus]|uniref:ATP-dependent RNA helicase DbpA n=1 Tax=Granulosicoccus antarcticus IMCC3135 TaxID=1192854 RepID=A0A2Z2P4E5_9GAMM|nr:ATP-dependent RNA helicase DbpA [Granulosicoccus antarcticus]ASJ74704.1 ATP-dependent RNA helicase DbpA [Granulosicoccus antarcticus IMCC3135]
MTQPTGELFSSLPIRAELLEAVASLEYAEMTPIQAATLPQILEGRDVLAQARTGSGKTAAFAIGLLNKLDIQTFLTQSLVLCPTRELADQVASEIRRLASALPNTKVLTLCGGKPMQAQLASLKREAHVIVGTPGRILKHLEKGSLQVGGIKTLVLDEADRMLDMGFHDDIMRILDKTNDIKQSLLFSATYPDEIKHISAAVQKNPVEVRMENSESSEQIDQVFFRTTENGKKQALISVLENYHPASTLVFCNRKLHCQELTQALQGQGFSAKALHGDLDQYDRDESLIQFANNSISILVATDVAARGLDITDLSAVINYDLSHDTESHVHRIGRTGRAGSDGLAISLVLPNEDFRVQAIAELQNRRIHIQELPTRAGKSDGKLVPPTVTLHINAGRKDKIRPGDIVGALTASSELNKDDIGKITVLDKMAYVAVVRAQAHKALDLLANGKIKGRKFRVRTLR